MVTRRDALKTLGCGALALAAGRGAAAAPAWPPFRDMIAIDALTGTDLFYLKDGDPAIPVALQALRDSGLSGAMIAPAPQGRFWYDDAAFERTKNTMNEWKMVIERHPDAMLIVRTYADLERARRERKIGMIFTFQGTESLGEDPDRIPMFREMGLRVLQLTHNRRNLIGDGCMEPGNAGLSNLGHQVVERLNAEKIVIDLAHASQRTMREAILASKAPVFIGHSGCRALVDVPRLSYDEELKLLADRGGVLGIIFWPYIRKQGQQMAADVIRHIEYAVNLCGEDHVGIGTDLGISPVELTPAFVKDNTEYIQSMIEDGIFEKDRDPNLLLFPPDLNTADRFEILAGMLSARGHSDARIAKILGGNFARVMRDVWG
jgi:membrane dipeptidase